MTTSSTVKKRRNQSTDDVPNGTSAATTSTLARNDSEEDAWSSSGCEYINPFVHRLQIDSRVEWTKIYVLTVLLLPLRVVGCFLSMVSAWVFACIGMYGLTLDDIKAKPFTGWRKQIRAVVAGAMRMVFACGSFQYITFKGQRASFKEAPIMVIAPHSSYVDSIVVVATGPPSIVAKQETSQIPLLGKVINYAQPIYVQREDPNSRQNTIREIVSRARSNEDWPQVVIFAEGTCTNRSALIKFKPGAFYPGVPVQPVLLKYPNKYDTFTWTWDGPGVARLLWLTFSQFYSRCEIEYLPVYNPSEEEKQDAVLYAQNVREVMAKALGVPTSEYSFEDVIMMTRAKDMKIPFPGDIVEIEHTLYYLEILESDRDSELVNDFLKFPQTQRLDVITFAELLQVDLKNKHFHHLFMILDHSSSGFVDLKSYLLCSLFCKLKNKEVINYLRAITPIYAESTSSISRDEFEKIMRHSGKLPKEKTAALYFAIDHTNKGYISFNELEEYTSNRPEYYFLYRKLEQLRSTYKKTVPSSNK